MTCSGRGAPALGLVDLLLGEEPTAGLLLVAAYRDGEVDAAHPLAALLARWRDQPGVRAGAAGEPARRGAGGHGGGDAAGGPAQRRGWPG